MNGHNQRRITSPDFEVLHDSDLATVICGDARQVLPNYDKESIDLVVTDPPYGQAFQANTRAERFDVLEGDETPEAARDLLDGVTDDLVRVVRRSRHIYSFGLPLQHDLISDKSRVELIWDKGRLGGGNLKLPFGPSHETIYFQVRAPDRYNSEKGTGVLAARMRGESVLRVKRLSALQVSRHPTEKPVELLRQLIESSSSLDELVLDPFAGVGSTGVAAILEGRRCLLIEIDEGYAQTAADRVREAESIAEQAGAA